MITCSCSKVTHMEHGLLEIKGCMGSQEHGPTHSLNDHLHLQNARFSARKLSSL